MEYLEDICVNNTSNSSYCEAIKLSRGMMINDGVFDAIISRFNIRDDGVDFDFPGIARILTLYQGDPNLGANNEAALKEAVLNMMWWMDEPGGYGDMQMWSENHRLLFHSGQYLLGAALPGETFENSGATGLENRAKGKQLLERYLSEKIKWGFAEFCADTYNDFDVAALSTLAEIAPDENIRNMSAGVLDLLLYDIVSHAKDGIIISARGRPSTSSRFDFQTISCVIWLLSGIGRCGSTPPKGALSLAMTGTNYRPPQALLEAAKAYATSSTPIVTRERFGLDPDDAKAEGVTTSRDGNLTPEDAVLWFNHEGYLAPISATGFFVIGNEWDFWFHPIFKPLRPYRDLDFMIPLLSKMAPAVTGGSLLGPANVYAFATPHASLGSAIDYNAGGMAANQIVWTANLGHDAPIFVNLPGLSGFWRGSVSIPRVAQYERVLFSIFNPPSDILRFVGANRTHAFWPTPHLDETVNPVGTSTLGERWIFGRLGKGYVALISMNEFSFTTTGQYAMQELVAMGATNVWVCVIGDEDLDGDFSSFQTFVRGALTKLTLDHVVFDDLEFGWKRPFTKNGMTIVTNHFPRYDTPYLTAPWKSTCFLIHGAGSNTQLIEFSGTTSIRTENDPNALAKCPQTIDEAVLYADFDEDYNSPDLYRVPYFVENWANWVVFGALVTIPLLLFGIAYGSYRGGRFVYGKLTSATSDATGTKKMVDML